MKYTYMREGKEEEVQPEKWIWAVMYDDGKELHQFDKEGKFHQFQEIEQEKVRLFAMYEVGGNGRIDMPVIPGSCQLFHFYQNTISHNQETGQEVRVRVYVFGWKDKTTGATLYHHILPDNRVVSSQARMSVTGKI